MKLGYFLKLMKQYRIVLMVGVLISLLAVACGDKKEQRSTESSKGAQGLDPEVETKIDTLLAKMTLDEKVGQMCQITLDVMMKKDSAGKVLEPNTLDSAKVTEALTKYHVGSVLNVGYHTFDRDKWFEIIEHLQGVAVNDTKNGIPLIYGIDAIHGVTYTEGSTLFPQEITLAASWDRQSATDLGKVTAYETRASGISWNFSPVLDLGRQPLWSRFFETLGEDVYLSKEMGAEIVKGYQQGNEDESQQVISCLKHFVGYSNPKSGRDRTPAWIPDRYMKEYYLPAFKESIDAGALTVMVNSGEVNGIPGHSNYELLTTTLKDEWGFKGFAVSDWEDMIMLNTVAEIEPTYKEAIANAVNAGVDMSMVPYSPFYEKFCKALVELVNEGKVPMERIDDAVRRIIRVKYAANLFEKPFYPRELYEDFGSEKFQEKAFNAACEAITLLKNEESVLPLAKGKKVFVTGPTAHSLNCMNGAWTHTWQGVDTGWNSPGKMTVAQAMMEEFGEDKVSYVPGVSMKAENNWQINYADQQAKALSEAKKADYIVVCLGEFPGTERPGDINSLHLAQEQKDYVKALSKTGKPLVFVLLEGRPRLLNDIEPQAAAVVHGYLPGNEGGRAIAKVLSGEVNPSGKLPFTYPRYDGVIEHYDHKVSEMKNGKSSELDGHNPQWEFGHGLSYTSFEYSDLKLSTDSLNASEKLEVSVKVTNTGAVAGKEVVQLYLKDDYASISPAGKRLKAFDKIALEAGASQTVTFTLSEPELQFVGRENEWISEPGSFTVMVDDLNEKFELVAK